MNQRSLILPLLVFCAIAAQAQRPLRQGEPKLTELWEPQPKVITPGKTASDAPSDAIVLFNGSNADAWQGRDGGAIKWKLEDG